MRMLDISRFSPWPLTTHPVHLEEESCDGQPPRSGQIVRLSHLRVNHVELQRIPGTGQSYNYSQHWRSVQGTGQRLTDTFLLMGYGYVCKSSRKILIMKRLKTPNHKNKGSNNVFISI